MLLHGGWIVRRRVDLLIGLLLPLLVGGLESLKPCDLVWAVDQSEQGGELGINLWVCLVQRLEEGRIADKEITAEAGLLINYEFYKSICMDNDDVCTVNSVRAFLNTLQTITEDDSKDSECCNRECQETK
jgi:hypothetical protein